MTKGILGKKLGMTQVFGPNGTAVPVTVIEAGPCVVLQKKDEANDGYEAIQIGFDDKKEHRANKPEKGHAAKANTAPKRFVREIRGVNLGEFEVGQELKADIFAAGDVVDVSGVTKGKGYAGAIKRHNQSRGPMAHGSRYHRGPGSLGSIAANRVFKGQTLPGQLGTDNVTIQNLEVVRVDADRNLILVKGSIPGPKNSYVVVSTAVKNK
ncbi:50S ribosomal protein L3 [Brevibacillus fulvus]|uniref:Large ribosomal subunit protein uL3 n=1 Tax=Brevibacillus fulvus TaxID=1125967 RepID=A0A938Y262_9BACL|nr:50S ribosomal protein L3 [Brevibacillus fulvus]MBM7591941.1 large subunit ribosomal protein L3 [Brevibacillus fulvus]